MRERIFNKSLTFDTNSTSDESDVLKILYPYLFSLVMLCMINGFFFDIYSHFISDDREYDFS